MATEVDLKVGLNFEIGSIPLSLDMTKEDYPDKSVYTFDGCEQNADIFLGDFLSHVGSQFGLDVVLPPELNLEAKIDYVVGQMIYTKPTVTTNPTTTELGISGKFELILDSGKSFTFSFYADSIMASNATVSDKSYVIGAAFDLDFELGNLPLVGDIPGIKNLIFTQLGFSYTNLDPLNTTNKIVDFNIPSVDSDDNELYTRTPTDANNAKSYSVTTDGDTGTLAVDKKGFSLTAGFKNRATNETTDNVALPLDLETTTPDATNPTPTDFSTAETSPPSSSVKWMKLDKQVGPVNLEQIGLNYSGGEASFGFSAEFELGAFDMGLQELMITFPLPIPGIVSAGHEIDCDLAGMSLSIQEPGFEIGGAFLRSYTADGGKAYYGEASIKIGPLGFTALGGYTPHHTSTDANNPGDIPASFFLYSNLGFPPGGPPFLMVTGIAGGFGINNQLILPTLDNLSDYILLPSNAPGKKSDAPSTVADVLPQMQQYFVDLPGEYWVAAGMSFTSFEMINSFALLTTSFGVDFQVGIIGSASMVFPIIDPVPIANLEMDVIASFSPASGLLSIEGALAPGCFIFGPFCKLTGGFAFYLWFSGEHRGEVVVTVGGYHPAFTPPDYYPVVPKLSISYVLGPFHVDGSAYFALTSGAMMAGGAMNATWKLGNINAWFSTSADFMIAWAPFQYTTDIYINVGCSVNMGLFTINMHVGSELHVWGSPFGGTAHVDMGVVKFDITFGSPRSQPLPVGWSNFQSSFLPADTDTPAATPSYKTAAAEVEAPTDVPVTNIIKATVNAGLLSTDKDNLGAGVPGNIHFDWIIDPNNFQIEISSSIPINQPKWQFSDSPSYLEISNDPTLYNLSEIDVSEGPYKQLDATTQVYIEDTEVWNPSIDIQPMNQHNVQSILTFTIKKRTDGDTGDNFSDYMNVIAASPQLSNVSAAMWQIPASSNNANNPEFLYSALTGFVLSPIPRTPDTVNPVPLLELMFQTGNEVGVEYQSLAVDNTYTVTTEEDDTAETLTISISKAATETLGNANYVLNSINDNWVKAQRTNMLDALNAAGYDTYSNSEVTLTGFATETILTDWPEVLLLGDAM